MRLFSMCIAVVLLSGAGLSFAASDGVDEIVKLAAAGVGEDVLIAFVRSSSVAYDLTVDQITHLNDIGIPQKVVAAMLDRGRELRQQAAQNVTPAPVTAAAPPAAPPVPATPPATVYQFQQEPATATLAAQTVVADPSAPSALVAPPPEGVTLSFFYDQLTPYGRWLNDRELGWVWQPTVVVMNPGWRPYCHNGHWVWTDEGWFWSSHYSWGWAPFHYGRWFRSPVSGWVWAPDTVWAPAWVAWRSSESHYGWAPLPPGSGFDLHLGLTFHGKSVDIGFDFNLSHEDYAFVPTKHFMSRDLAPVAVPQHQVVNVYKSTTIVNNTYVVNNNSTTNNVTNAPVANTRIVNQGIPVQSVSQATNTKIQPVRLASVTAKTGDQVAGEQHSANQITVFRPAVQNKAPELPTEIAVRHKAAEDAARAQAAIHPPASYVPPTTAAKLNTGTVPPTIVAETTKKTPDTATSLGVTKSREPDPTYVTDDATKKKTDFPPVTPSAKTRTADTPAHVTDETPKKAADSQQSSKLLRFHQLRHDMSPDEVEKIVGAPTEEKKGGVWVYNVDESTLVSVGFTGAHNGKLTYVSAKDKLTSKSTFILPPSGKADSKH